MSFNRFVPAILAVLALSAQSRADGIEVQDAYAISTGAMAQTGAAYMTLLNHGDSEDRLRDVRSDAAARVQIHQSAMAQGGVMSMVHITDPLPLPAGGQLVFDRGGYHIMFMGLTAPFEPGAIVAVTLVFDRAGEVLVQVPVAPSRPGAGDMMQMDHD